MTLFNHELSDNLLSDKHWILRDETRRFVTN